MKNISEIIISALSIIKNLLGKKVNYSLDDSCGEKTISHEIWDKLLKSHVDIEGQVNYKGFIADFEKLEEYTQLLTNNPPAKNWDEKEQLAYWINAYNAFTVKLVSENYPINGIREIAGKIPLINSVWDIKFFKIGKLDFDLNTIEHEILRKLYDEPRIHFALNCASISCPSLRNEAYITERLEVQLNDQAISFLNNRNQNQLSENNITLSKLFDWYLGDFTKNQSLLMFLEKYVTIKFEKHPKIQYMPYNWNLNENNG